MPTLIKVLNLPKAMSISFFKHRLKKSVVYIGDRAIQSFGAVVK